ncbi:MAG: acyltransferase [Rhodanobacteraceae bacterium]
MQPVETSRRRFASLFNAGENARHLIHRPQHQEPVVDGVRAIAVLWVVMLHMFWFQSWLFPEQIHAIFAFPASGWLATGALGVDLFFVISGFLIGSILFGEFRKTGGIIFTRFYVRRFLRLIPVYVMVMLMGLYFLDGHNVEHAWANLLYINNFLPIKEQYMGWCWSLAIEEQFYLIFPAFIMLFMGLGKGRLRILVALMGLSLVIRFSVIHAMGITPPFRITPDDPHFYPFFDNIYDKPWTRFGGLLAGATGAFLSTFHAERIKRFFSHTWRVTGIALLCLAVMAHVACTPFTSAMFSHMPPLARELWLTLYRDVFSLATIFLILAAIHTPRLFGGGLRRFLSWKGFYPVAQVSYSLYMIHEMIFNWLFPSLMPILQPRIGIPATIAVNAVIGVLISFALACLLYTFIERPCMRMRSHPPVLRMTERLRFKKAGPVSQKA